MENEKQDYIVALSIDKVQTLLYEVIHSHVQEKQKETHTLRQIKQASHEISNGFFGEVKEAFEDMKNYDVLLQCSGVVIFRYHAMEAELDRRLNQLFFKYYTASQGQKLLKYTYFKEKPSEIENIQTAKQNLKCSKCTAKIIEQNKEHLFSFQKVCTDAEQDSSPDDDLSLFVEGMNDLYPYEKDSKAPPYEDNHFPVAIIKADLSGMGDMFSKTREYDVYQQISAILNQYISLKGLHSIAQNQDARKEKQDAWIFPFYAAGDDIFFAVAVTNLFRGIDVCRNLIATINEKLHEKGINQALSVDIGVAITFNREPIRYYIEQVEQQLAKAKQAQCPEELKAYLQAKIGVNNQIFFDVDYSKIKEEKQKTKGHKGRCDCSSCEKKKAINRALNSNPIWCFFKKDINELWTLNADKKLRQELCSTSFLYSLLENLSSIRLQKNSGCKKYLEYMNVLLYSLRLKHLDNPQLREKELFIKGRIINQLYIKEEGIGDVLTLNPKSKDRLENYIRLLILLTDSRFHIPKKENDTIKYDETDTKNMHKLLLKKPVDYLYDKLRNYDRNLIDTIIVRDTYKVSENRKKSIYVPYYKRVNIEKSMFFRIRNTDKVSVEKAASMIKLKNPDDIGEIINKNKSRGEEQKAPYHLYFDEEEFKRQANARNTWDATVIDSLMLLYEYNEMDITLKGINNTRKGNQKKGAKICKKQSR
jgi:hypothetical protein